VSRLWVDDFVTAPQSGSIAEQSYLGNYLYWLIYPLTRTVNATFEGSYWDWQYETYDTHTIWDIHEQQEIELQEQRVDGPSVLFSRLLNPTQRRCVQNTAQCQFVKEGIHRKRLRPTRRSPRI
jgi:hypothetical protein